jgi:Predicted membrane protein (DUF2335)
VSSGDAEEQTSPDPPGPGEAASNLPPALREALNRPGVSPELVQMTVAAFAGFYSGPLPPAEQIRAYEDVLPGSADRILRMAEHQQEHRMELERVTVREAANRVVVGSAAWFRDCRARRWRWGGGYLHWARPSRVRCAHWGSCDPGGGLRLWPRSATQGTCREGEPHAAIASWSRARRA